MPACLAIVAHARRLGVVEDEVIATHQPLLLPVSSRKFDNNMRTKNSSCHVAMVVR